MHMGVIDDPRRAVAAELRIHALTERLIFALLGGEKEWTDLEAYKHCSPLSSGMAWPPLM